MKSVDNGKIWGKEGKYGKILFKITFSNNNFNYLDDDLKTLNDCIEIIKRHQYHYSFTNRSLSIKIGS